MSHRRIPAPFHHGPLIAVLALLTAACGNHPSGGGSDPSTPPSTPDQSTTTPAIEATGPEPPPPAAGGPPAIEIASLPVGGGADDDTSVHQCVGVSWLGSRIPDGVSVLITAVRIQPSGVFTQSTSGCARPLCNSSFAFTADQDRCTVPVTAKGRPGASARLSVDGRVRCPAGQRRSCEAFTAAAKKQSIQLTVPDQAPPAPVDPPRPTG
jgi:hypothetical protein